MRGWPGHVETGHDDASMKFGLNFGAEHTQANISLGRPTPGAHTKAKAPLGESGAFPDSLRGRWCRGRSPISVQARRFRGGLHATAITSETSVGYRLQLCCGVPPLRWKALKTTSVCGGCGIRHAQPHRFDRFLFVAEPEIRVRSCLINATLRDIVATTATNPAKTENEINQSEELFGRRSSHAAGTG